MAFKDCFYLKPIGGNDPMTIGIPQEDVEKYNIDWQYGFEKPDGSEPDWHPFVSGRTAYLDIPLNTKCYFKGNSSLAYVENESLNTFAGTLEFYRSSIGGDAYEVGGSPQSLVWDGDGTNTNAKARDADTTYTMGLLFSGKEDLPFDLSHLILPCTEAPMYYVQFFMDSRGLYNLPNNLLQGEKPGTAEYSQMFMGTNITKVPQGFLKATDFSNEGCYSELFRDCSELNEIWFNLEEWPPEGKFNLADWVEGVASTGTFYCPSKLPRIFDGSHIPPGWTVKSSKMSRPTSIIFRKKYVVGGRKKP